jgi:methylmalonyl-CoA/ethylmalonyl-CoA epimerase
MSVQMIDNEFGLKFHHLGLAVKETGPAFRFLQGTGYRCAAQVYDPLQKVDLAMFHHANMPAVEVISPATESGPVDRLLMKRPEGIIYHVCYETADLRSSLGKIEETGLSLFEVSQPTPAALFGGRMVSFYMIANFGLIEILE